MSLLPEVLPPSAEVSPAGHLVIGGCDLVELVAEHGTPLVIYDEGLLRASIQGYRDAFAAQPGESEVIYASKAYWGRALLRMIEAEGLSIDVASGGELYVAVEAGFPPERIYMHGNNKDAGELSELLDVGVGTVILDSHEEIGLLSRLAAERGMQQKVLVRVTPGVRGDTHEYISTGQVDSKFGFPLADGQAAAAIEAARAAPGLEFVGLHAHIGSQLLDISRFASAAAVMADLAASVGGDDIRVMNMGGGLGIAYTRDHVVPPVTEYAATIVTAVRQEWERVGIDPPKVLVEPGRSIVGRAGVHVYTVGSVKRIPGVRTYVSVDGGMSDLLRPMLYGAEYEVVLVNRAAEAPADEVRVVGKHCESGDVLAGAVALPEVVAGDLLALPASGAYGMSMSSNYNGQLRPPVVFVDGGTARLVARREHYSELVAREL